MRWRGELRTGEALAYVSVQVMAAIVGVLLVRAMFDLPLIQPAPMSERVMPSGSARRWPPSACS